MFKSKALHLSQRGRYSPPSCSGIQAKQKDLSRVLPAEHTDVAHWGPQSRLNPRRGGRRHFGLCDPEVLHGFVLEVEQELTESQEKKIRKVLHAWRKHQDKMYEFTQGEHRRNYLYALGKVTYTELRDFIEYCLKDYPGWPKYMLSTIKGEYLNSLISHLRAHNVHCDTSPAEAQKLLLKHIQGV